MNLKDLTEEYSYDNKPTIKSAEDIYKLLEEIKDATKEIIIAFYLDTKNKVIAKEIIAIGTLNTNIIHPREIFRGAIIRNANAIIIAHNHPSGDPEPSENDKEVTQELTKAGDIIGIKVLDHIIAGKNNFISLKETGVI